MHLQLDNTDFHWNDPSEGLLHLSEEGRAKGKAGVLTAAAQNKHIIIIIVQYQTQRFAAFLRPTMKVLKMI